MSDPYPHLSDDEMEWHEFAQGYRCDDCGCTRATLDLLDVHKRRRHDDEGPTGQLSLDEIGEVRADA